MLSQEDFENSLAKGWELAPSLIGLDIDAAVQRVAAAGHQAQILAASLEGMPAELDPYRIRLFVDDGLVVRAVAG